MSEIYLPHYISTEPSICALTNTPNMHLVAIRIRNYNILETLMSDASLRDMVLSIEGKIGEFCASNAILDCQVISVRDYIFVTHNNPITDIVGELRKFLYSVDMPVYISFGIVSSCIVSNGLVSHDRKILNILPCLVQNLAHADNGLYVILDNDTITNEYRMLNLLTRALNNKKAGFAYQPIIDATDGSVAYHECLMRIPDQNGEWISAGPAILLAEKYCIIDMVDEAVITMAEEELRASPDIDIAVNISNIGLLNNALLKKIIQTFTGNDNAKRLIIEVTETSENADLETTLHFVETVRGLGIRVALDDFGVGTTSFRQLCTIKFDIIKIDGSFITDIATNPYHRFITEIIVKLCKDTGAKAVAEFVENGEIAKILIDLGVNFMQGNFFSPAQNVRSWNNSIYLK